MVTVSFRTVLVPVTLRLVGGAVPPIRSRVMVAPAKARSKAPSIKFAPPMVISCATPLSAVKVALVVRVRPAKPA